MPVTRISTAMANNDTDLHPYGTPIFITGSADYRDINEMASPELRSILVASGTGGSFGNRGFDVSGDWAVVGAYSDGEIASNAGAAYIYHRNDLGVWREHSKLTLSDGVANDYFGESVAIHGSTVVVGAYQRDTNSLSSNGVVYVYEFNQTNDAWEQIKTYDGAISNSRLGDSVSVHGDRIAVAASGEQKVYLAEKIQGVWPAVMTQVTGVTTINNGDIQIVDDLLAFKHSSNNNVYLYQQNANGGWAYKVAVGGTGAFDLSHNLLAVGYTNANAVTTYTPEANGSWTSAGTLNGSAVNATSLGSVVAITDGHILAMSSGQLNLYRQDATDTWQHQAFPDVAGSYLAADGETLLAGVNQSKVFAFDLDGVRRDQDNCPDHVNANQVDNDSDGIGDRCDADSASDADGDGVINFEDQFIFDAFDSTDFDGDGIGDNRDTDDDNDGILDSDDASWIVMMRSL